MSFLMFLVGVITGVVMSYVRGAFMRWEDDVYESDDDEQQMS